MSKHEIVALGQVLFVLFVAIAVVIYILGFDNEWW